ncbi:14544_t:CDS:2 [Entrophospora sp. SA101]|nr:8246_t:CDS:2 [Entrophospora sp. SA101]CAJ0894916.1 14544_t:CDS:2 [Entrophospora sp. SA101]
MVHQRNGHHNGDSYYKDKDRNGGYNRHDNSYSAPYQRSSPKNSSSKYQQYRNHENKENNPGQQKTIQELQNKVKTTKSQLKKKSKWWPGS